MKPVVKAALAAMLVLATGTVLADSVLAASSLIEKQSPYSVKQTLDRFEAVLNKKGITIFARINHAAGAEKIGQKLLPTELLIFGSPKMGTPLMTASRRIGIDLPLKLLAWRAADGEVRIAYNDPARLKARHQVEGRDKVFGKMAAVLNALTDAALK